MPRILDVFGIWQMADTAKQRLEQVVLQQNIETLFIGVVRLLQLRAHFKEIYRVYLHDLLLIADYMLKLQKHQKAVYLIAGLSCLSLRPKMFGRDIWVCQIRDHQICWAGMGLCKLHRFNKLPHVLKEVDNQLKTLSIYLLFDIRKLSGDNFV